MPNRHMSKIIDNEFMKLFTSSAKSLSTASTKASLSTSDFLQTWKDISNLAKPTLNIISSNYCYKKIIKSVGIRSKRKPNTRRPFYKNKPVIIPLAYRFENQIICHPSIEEKLRRGMEVQVRVIPKSISFDFQFKPLALEQEDNQFKFRYDYGWRIGLYNPIKHITGS